MQHGNIVPQMRVLTQAPNVALATLWADMLKHAGIEASVQRYFASSIVGQIPPDQALPEVWVQDDAQLDDAKALLREFQRPPWRAWICRGCGERIDGPFEQCWNCGTAMPA
jgi:hypothetical protein